MLSPRAITDKRYGTAMPYFYEVTMTTVSIKHKKINPQYPYNNGIQHRHVSARMKPLIACAFIVRVLYGYANERELVESLADVLNYLEHPTIADHVYEVNVQRRLRTFLK